MRNLVLAIYSVCTHKTKTLKWTVYGDDGYVVV